ncbi:MAG TPA: gamma-glutamylcyclotransferase family protein [Gammaproteobacteria bacterium]|nr:gamma-glutamylcyclotransferase family protein [Gammaproteobacteria bacterium]
MSTLLYLAYGSNLHPRWLQSRVPSAEIVQKTSLDGWSLRFNKHSHTDGSAKCNILETGNANDCVHGVVYRLKTIEKAALDRAEGGYNCVDVNLPDLGQVMVYLARTANINNELRPYSWYRDIVIAGAILHGLPENYINRIKTVEAITDTDPAREREHRSIVWPESV